MSISNDKLTRAQELIDYWKLSLVSKDKTIDNVESNFDEIFNDLYSLDLDYESALGFLQSIIEAHIPPQSVCKSVYKRSSFKGLSLHEFSEGWKKRIVDIGNTVFTSYFQPEKPKVKKRITFGNMDPEEYARQRAYADSYPRLTPKRVAEIKEQHALFLQEVEKIEQQSN